MTMSSVQPNPTRHQPPRRWRDFAVPGALLGFALIGLIGLAAATGWRETQIQLSRLGYGQFLGLLGLSLVNYLMRGVRWHLFTRRLKLATGLMQDLRHFLGGFALSVTPGRLGELVRMRWLKRETGHAVERTAPLALIDRASDLAAMALILGIAVAFSTTAIAGALPVSLAALLVSVLVTRPALLTALITLVYRGIGRWPRFFARAREGARALGQFSDIRLVLPTLLLGAVGWLAEGYAFYLLLSWLGAEVALAQAVAIFIFSTLAGGLTGAPGGVGGAEATMIALLGLQGVPMEISLPATAVIRITTLWFAIAIGLLLFPIAERQSLRVKNALEN
ncbi:MAG: YbhN family protein [Halocynthiibacter sp.]